MTISEVKRKYTKLEKMTDGWCLYLQIDHQGFLIIEATSKKQANWWAEMLAIALKRLIEKNQK